MVTPAKAAVKRPNVRLHCNDCHHKTFHRLLKSACDEGSEPFNQRIRIWWKITHQMFECCGCKSVVLRRIHEFSEWDGAEIRFFPPPASRRKPDWFHKIPHELASVLNEVYNSLDADNRALPMMGARAVLDMVIVDKVGDVGGFAEKLKQLEAQGFISQKNRQVLDVALDAGSAAAHRGYAPQLAEVHSVMDIVENLLQAIYVLDKVAAEVKKSTPVRPASKRQQKT